MARSDFSLKLEKLERALDPSRRLVDMAARLRVWRCSCGQPHGPTATDTASLASHAQALRAYQHQAQPAELIPRVYGGKYDRLTRRYVGRADSIIEVACHEGQLPLLTFDEPGVLRVLALGSPGAGKTFGGVRRALLECLKWPNTIGALVAPTNDRRQILWRDFLELVEPLGWVEDVAFTKREITLVNRVVVQVLAVKAASRQWGNPAQGRSWDWAVVDESQNVDDEAHAEIATRGRRAGQRFRIFETATNAMVPTFRVRLEELKDSPQARILRFTGHQNPWIDPEWWERLRGDMSEREFRQRVLAEDVAPELLLYPEFQYARHVGPLPLGSRDVTPEVVNQRFQRQGIRWVAAQDFGSLVTCTEMLKCYDLPDRRRVWVAKDEITTRRLTADMHARRILDAYPADEVLVIADPHFNTADTDRSDYSLFQREGLNIMPAKYDGILKREHRYSMVNLALRDGRVLIESDPRGQAKCPMLVRSFLTMQRNDYGEAERDRKDKNDMSHWSAAFGYGIFPFERIRGYHVQDSRNVTTDPLLLRLQAKTRAVGNA